MTPYAPPSLNDSSFNCPHCQAFAHHIWHDLSFYDADNLSQIEMDLWRVSQCAHCSNFTLWNDEDMVYPVNPLGSSPNPDMPQDIIDDFEEARSIAQYSPRGAAALFRLCIQKLCRHLGEPGKNINDDIRSLVQKGLDERIQQSLDIVRVIGNEAVHPGEMDLRDKTETAIQLATLVNLIANETITKHKLIIGLYDSLPPNKVAEIKKRDAKK
ncbi:conserved hypothetical protein [Pedosphaera parvula Ellin514]|uniref:DUF4145 domain-containing protein n=2 Tax=Pedosphaera TaxID=1032526 RepID=B9XA27_PEDPL|nr:conserved hypothetical protein [Pedosphaera parvula Ellin514]